jgi:hypothetical protein
MSGGAFIRARPSGDVSETVAATPLPALAAAGRAKARVTVVQAGQSFADAIGMAARRKSRPLRLSRRARDLRDSSAHSSVQTCGEAYGNTTARRLGRAACPANREKSTLGGLSFP